MRTHLAPGRCYVLIRPGADGHRDRVSVIRIVDQQQHEVLWSAAGDVEDAAVVVAAQGWTLDGEWITTRLGVLALLRRTGPGQPPKHGPVKQVSLRLPQEVYDAVKAAADAAGHSVNDEIIARCRS